MNITATLIAQMVAFLLLIWLVNRLLWGPLTAALDNRRKQIEEGLAAAEQGKKELEEAQQRSEGVHAEARTRAEEIIAQAEKRASGIVGDARSAAQQESERIKQAAQSEIEQQVLQARETLRREVSAIAVLGASRILGRKVDAAAHAAALKELESRI